ncbi:MAG: GCN5-related N-acetyltransferase [Ferruginibacter sp.]|nr:GCN5-related N-acetyltransferase [Ferruginibacter sp.]
MEFRNAVIDDLPDIVAIYNAVIPGRMVTADTEPVTVADKLAWFNEHTPNRRPLWIVAENNTTIGWVSFQDFYGRPAYNGTAEISIYLHESAQHKGNGRKILQYAFEQCPALGIDKLLGFIFAHNKPSLRLFESLGFSEWGHLEDIAFMDNKTFSLKILGKHLLPKQST